MRMKYLTMLKPRVIMLAAAVLLAAACGSAVTPSATTPTPTATPSQSASPPSGFICADAAGGSESAMSRITSVTREDHGSHATFRIAFDGAVPAYTIRRQTNATFTLSPKDEAVVLAGTTGVLITVQHVLDWTSYAGPTELSPSTGVIREARLVQNFEGVVQWGLGVQGSGCLQVSTPGGTALEVGVAAS